jgi:Domain of unknown function (DUF4167)
MQNGQHKNRNTRYSRPPLQYADRSKRRSSNSSGAQPKSSHSAQRNYERYLTLAQVESQSGNAIGAENYYQYAEHYFRMMSSDKIAT